MRLAEKLRYLREVEGELRGMGRAMSQGELVRALAEEGGTERISQSYLSQMESGARPHLTNTTRLKLARFFKVHPGYLVDDPEGYHAELLSEARVTEDRLDLWLVSGAERFRRDLAVCRALLTIARHPESARCLQLLGRILEEPGLTDRLMAVLQPEPGEMPDAGCGPVEVRAAAVGSEQGAAAMPAVKQAATKRAKDVRTETAAVKRSRGGLTVSDAGGAASRKGRTGSGR